MHTFEMPRERDIAKDTAEKTERSGYTSFAMPHVNNRSHADKALWGIVWRGLRTIACAIVCPRGSEIDGEEQDNKNERRGFMRK